MSLVPVVRVMAFKLERICDRLAGIGARCCRTIGSALWTAPGAIRLRFSRASCDVTDDVRYTGVMDEVDPHIVINAAAYTQLDGRRCATWPRLSTPTPPPCWCDMRTAHAQLVPATDFVFDGRSPRPYR